jgi:hypothetical protein
LVENRFSQFPAKADERKDFPQLFSLAPLRSKCLLHKEDLDSFGQQRGAAMDGPGDVKMRSGWIVALAAGFLGTGLVRAELEVPSAPPPAAEQAAKVKEAAKDLAKGKKPLKDQEAAKDKQPVKATAKPANGQNEPAPAHAAGKEPAKENGQPAPLPLGCAAPAAGDKASPLAAALGPVPAPLRFWGEADLLLWWIKDSQTPPLVSVGPAGSGAILTQGGTTVFGGSIDNEERLGGRFAVGAWLDCEEAWAIEGDYLFLASRGVPFNTGSNGGPGSPTIGRPFFNVLLNAEDAQLIAAPGILAGTVGVNLTSRLQGAELNLVYHPCTCCCHCWRLELLGGFRYLELHEGLGIAENLQVFPGVPIIGGDQISLFDQFDTTNRFYGGQLGGRAEVRRGPWIGRAWTKVALGVDHETVTINGSTTIVTPTSVTVAQGGFLALPSNIGRFNRDAFAVVPEAGLSVGCQVNEHLAVFAGYTFLYWSDVARPGDQIDRVINPTQLPVTMPTGGLVGPARPSFTFKDTDFWAQGIHVGVEFRF